MRLRARAGYSTHLTKCHQSYRRKCGQEASEGNRTRRQSERAIASWSAATTAGQRPGKAYRETSEGPRQEALARERSSFQAQASGIGSHTIFICPVSLACGVPWSVRSAQRLPPSTDYPRPPPELRGDDRLPNACRAAWAGTPPLGSRSRRAAAGSCGRAGWRAGRGFRIGSRT